MRISLFLSLLAGLGLLTACTPRYGHVLDTEPMDDSAAVFLTVPDEEYFWVVAMNPDPEAQRLPDTQVPKGGLWLSSGWYLIESMCFSPKDAPPAVDPILPENDLRPVHLQGGQRYLMKCDDKVLGKFDLLPLDAPAAP